MTTTQPQLQWVAPSPLWPSAAALATQPAQMRQPAILRFTSDHFIDELRQAVAAEPVALPVADWESARLPPAGQDPSKFLPTRPANAPLKLFQPIHGRFYMVAASLVCQAVGLPDHALRIANQERAFFVVRQIRTDAKGSQQEMAWVQDPSFPNDKTKKLWQVLPDQSTRPQLAKNEELMPLFPVFIPKTATRPARRLHAGLIPTSSRDTLASTGTTAPSGVDVAVAEAEQRVASAYDGLVTSINHVLVNNLPPPPPAPTLSDLQTLAGAASPDPAIAALVQASVFLALDLADVLNKYVPDVFGAIVNGDSPPGGASGALYQSLTNSVFDANQGVQWSDAIKAAWSAKDAINDPSLTTPAVPTFSLFFAAASGSSALNPGVLQTQLQKAIETLAPAAAPPDPSAAAMIVPKFDGRFTYVVRCVFQRCVFKGQQFAALFPALLSDPSEPFEIAPFFDTDAPARTIRIPMPIDTSPSGLRKFPKSVGFLLSDKLQQQICQASDFASLLKGQMNSCAPFQLGQICSFSIPIITIIAMFLMMLMAIVLNIIFWWLPFLKICIPIPFSAPSEPEEA